MQVHAHEHADSNEMLHLVTHPEVKVKSVEIWNMLIYVIYKEFIGGVSCRWAMAESPALVEGMHRREGLPLCGHSATLGKGRVLQVPEDQLFPESQLT